MDGFLLSRMKDIAICCGVWLVVNHQQQILGFLGCFWGTVTIWAIIIVAIFLLCIEFQ